MGSANSVLSIDFERYVKEAASHILTPTHEEVPPETVRAISNALTASMLSLSTGPPEDALLRTHCRSDLHVVQASTAAEVGDTKFIVASDEAREQYWMAFGGSETWADMMTGAKEASARLVEGNVHAGYWKRAMGVPDSMLRVLAALLEQGKTVTITGHGMGGAVAALVCVRLLQELSRPQLHVQAGRLRCITFGQPNICDSQFASAMHANKWDQAFFSIVHVVSVCAPLLRYLLLSCNWSCACRVTSCLSPLGFCSTATTMASSPLAKPVRRGRKCGRSGYLRRQKRLVVGQQPREPQRRCWVLAWEQLQARWGWRLHTD